MGVETHIAYQSRRNQKEHNTKKYIVAGIIIGFTITSVFWNIFYIFKGC